MRCVCVCFFFLFFFSCNSGPGSVVGIATSYGLDGPGIESWWGRDFSAPVQTGPGAHPASCTMGTGSFLGVRSGRGVTLTPHPIQEGVELYLYSPYRLYGMYTASVPIQGCTLPVPYTEERCSNNCNHILNAVFDVTAIFVPILKETECGKGIKLACCTFELLGHGCLIFYVVHSILSKIWSCMWAA
jgi:hypothetical protein